MTIIIIIMLLYIYTHINDTNWYSFFSFPAEAMQSFCQSDWESSKHHFHLLEDSAAGGRLLWKQLEGTALIYLWTRGRSSHLHLLLYVHSVHQAAVQSVSKHWKNYFKQEIKNTQSCLKRLLYIVWHLLSLDAQIRNSSKNIFRKSNRRGNTFPGWTDMP